MKSLQGQATSSFPRQGQKYLLDVGHQTGFSGLGYADSDGGQTVWRY
jgi:hypothetical protein